MEVASLALSAVQTVLTALDDRELNVTLSSIIGYKSQIEGLKKTVRTIDCVLRSAAETKVELSLEEQNLIEELKDVIFEADDLLDEFVTLAQKKKLLQIDGTISEKVKLFFSPSNNAYRMAKGVKKIQKKLDAIASDSRFSFKIDPEPIRKRSRETCSYVNQVDIIGRQDDLEKIVGMLLDSTVEGDVSFLAIVGMGGLGKTALAQLVYNHPRVTSSFPLRLWICVSDQDQIQLDIEGILRKMLDEATGEKKECSSFEQVQRKLREQLQGNKYLIVLDDVWTENCVQWRELVKYLVCGEEGSRIVVTTRSQKTATIVGGGEMMYELHGLLKEDSWCLFEKTAFGSDLSTPPPNDLVEIGREIVNGCAGVPLAIRVAGSLLYGQDKRKWQSVQRTGLANIREGKNDIMPILKLSFHHLESPLKSCFSYCAMFPKDYVMYKTNLISLWMAQSYIVPLDDGQSIEDAGEEYFSILVKRCFFQDIEKDEFGEIKSCKIHDLMHDIAQDVSGKEIYATNVIRGDIDKKVRHLSFSTRGEYGKYSLGKGTHIRSHLCVQHPISVYVEQIVVKQILENCRRLRALDLSDMNLTSLPHCIGELLHLRYLDLSGNIELEVLPKSITNLCNLQTLSLSHCYMLQELPKGLGRLVNLRDLNIYDCGMLNCMGMGELSWLHRLSNFNVGERIIVLASWKRLYDDLENLKPLNSLKGHLHINITWPFEIDIYDVEEDNGMEELYMLSKEHLVSISIEGHGWWEGNYERRSRLMKGLQPHPNLKHLKIHGCKGVRTISWVSHLPNLVSLDIQYCEDLKYLPSLQNLLYLKSLSIRDLDNLEYIVEGEANNSSSAMHASSADQVSIIFFPSLEKLELSNLPEFEGWRRVVEGVEDSSEPEMQLNYFPQLKSLSIYGCPGIMMCPSVENLHLDGFNSGLQNEEEKVAESSSISYIPRLREVDIDNVAWLTSSLPMESFLYLKSLAISDDDELVSLPDWMQYLAHLQTLKISGCKRLEAMSNWMPELTSLNSLKFECCSQVLMRRCQKDPPGEDWPHIQGIPDIQFYSYTSV